MKKFKIVSLFILLAGSALAQSPPTSKGKEFYGMVMQNSGSVGNGQYFRVFLSCPYTANAEVSITDGSFDQKYVLTPNVVTTINLPASAEVTTNETPQLKAIHVVADTEISMYVIYHKPFSSDSYLALPVTALGTDYMAVSYQSSAQSFGDPRGSEFGIVATEDTTIVTITPSSSTQNNHPLGKPFSVTLNHGQTYLVYGNANDMSSDLTGTAVSATKPIAFLSGHDRTELFHAEGASRNCLVEQIPPNNTLGTSFLTVPYAGRPSPVPDYFRIVAPYNNTAIQINGTTVATINAGKFYEVSSIAPQQILTTKPVLVAQYSQSETDPSGNYINGRENYLNWDWDPTMCIIPPTQQYLNDYIFANSIDTAFKSNYVNVVIADSATSSLVLDGVAVKTPFKQITNTGFSYAQISTGQGSHHISAEAPFALYMYGTGPADAYANTGGAAFINLYQGNITVSLPQLTGLAGGQLYIPLTIDSSQNLELAGAKHFHVVLSYDRTVLDPLDTNKGVLAGNNNVFSFTDTLTDTIGVILTQSFMPTFGDADTIPLVIDSFTVDSKNVTVNAINGQLIIAGDCPTIPTRIIYIEPPTLSQNTPNPAAQTANITYTLTEQGNTNLTIYDMLGRKVKMLANAVMQPGTYIATVDASSLAPGVYYYILQTPTQRLSRTLMIER